MVLLQSQTGASMATGLKRFVRSLLGERVYGAAHAILMAGPKDIGYHRLHAVEAAGILKSLEDKYGRTNPTHIRLADAYARDVLGHACYAPWLRVYTAFARTFKEGWIPDNYYGHIVVPAMKGWYGQISNLKALTSTVFRSDAFPDVACYVNGLFLGTDNARICERDVAAFLFRETDRVTFKAEHVIFLLAARVGPTREDPATAAGRGWWVIPQLTRRRTDR